MQGAIESTPACNAALRRWLARRAVETLPAWLRELGHPFRLEPADVAIKSQRTRWASCATSGRISLNCKLLFLPRELVRYVLVQELCHLREPSHSTRFWAQVRQLDRAADAHHVQMREAWQRVPPWAQRGAPVAL